MLLALGAVLGGASLSIYGASGYSGVMLGLWLAAVLAILSSFELGTARLPLAVRDVAIPLGLAFVFAPLYLLRLYSWPVQVNSDEIVVMTVAKRWSERAGVDPFGISDYFMLPVLPFLVMGRLAQHLGGIELEKMRLLHALIGLATIAASYALFRQLLARPWAIFAAGVLGLNHAFLMISRMAMHHATAVLVEVVALALLLQGLRRGALGPAFLGGLVAGLGFYAYYPGRAVFVLWILFLLVVAIFSRRTMPLRTLARQGAVAGVGFVLMAGPTFIAEQKAPPESVGHFQTELLLFSEGRELQKDWVFASSEWEGVRTNIVNGLTTFNNHTVDHSWNYPNYGHGFVDPLAGGLLWLGVAVTVVALTRRRRPEPWMLLPLVGFVTIWLTLSFVVNKAPNYTRLEIALPFVAYLVTAGVRFLVEVVQLYAERWSVKWAMRCSVVLAAALLVGIGAWNLTIAADFVEDGRAAGDDIGSTGRYVHARRDVPHIRFYMATSDRWPYYEWGWPSMWEARMRMFSRDGQVGAIVAPNRAAAFKAPAPFVLFMSRDLWERAGSELDRRYPRGSLDEIVPDGRLVAFRTTKPAARSRP